MSRATRMENQRRKREKPNTFFYRFETESGESLDRAETIEKTLALARETEGFSSAFIANMGITFVGIPKEAAVLLVELYAKNFLTPEDAEELIGNIRQSNTLIFSLQKVVTGGE